MVLAELGAVIISFVITLIVTPVAIRYFRLVGITTRDVHKRNKPLLPQSLGVPVAAGVVGSLLAYIFVQVFIFNNYAGSTIVFAALTSIILVMFGGFLDDINSSQISSRYNEGKKGLNKWQKILLTAPAVVPLMAIVAGDTVIYLPFVGHINIGLLYPLLVVPAGIIIASNMVNMLGGFNGIEVGMGLIYTFSLGLFALMHEKTIASLIFFTTSAALLAALKYNFYPAKILPGDSIQYLMGSVVAIGAILGGIEAVAIITMIPFIVQAFIKFYAIHKLQKTPADMGVLQRDGSIKSRYGKKIWSLTHIVMNLGRFKEWQIVLIFVGVQAIFSSIPILMSLIF
jgi:UDP-N-acetylglucosamine--dolichyl-phosphate N-acetylglucosaminephosphotransferase